MRDSELHQRGWAFFGGVSTGALTASLGFWLAYDQWKPLVWAACVAAAVAVIRSFAWIVG